MIMNYYDIIGIGCDRMTINEQYQELLKYRKNQPSNILVEKQRNAWAYFRNIANVTNLEKNINSNSPLYYAPLKQIHGSNMVSWPVQNGSEIYVDEEFAANNETLVNIQLQHEILHNLANRVNGNQSFFGYAYDGSGKSNYIGINEATTQMFAEDIIGLRLDEETYYLYFIKNIMRIIKALFGKELLAGQYLNNDLNFTNAFNNRTSYKFEPFAQLMNDIYYLSREKKYKSLSENQIEELTKKQQSILDFTSGLIYQFSKDNKDIVNDVCFEIQDNLFIKKLNLQSLDNSNSIHHSK